MASKTAQKASRRVPEAPSQGEEAPSVKIFTENLQAVCLLGPPDRPGNAPDGLQDSPEGSQDSPRGPQTE
eukprot:243486-Pyramimonas_sp.AAC.2